MPTKHPVEMRPPLASWHLGKYLTVEILKNLIFGTLVFLLLMLSFQAIRLSDFFVIQQVPIIEIFKITVYLLTSFLPLAIPLALLFSVLSSVSRANVDGELMALSVCGVSTKQVIAPIILVSALVAGVCLYLSLNIVPQGNRNFELLFTQMGARSVTGKLQPGTFSESFLGMVVYADEYDKEEGSLRRVFIYHDRNSESSYVITAQKAQLRSARERGRLTLRLFEGAIHIDQPKMSARRQKINFDVYDMNLAFSSGKEVHRDASIPSLLYGELKRRIANEKDPSLKRRLSVEVHRRFSQALSCLVFAILGFFISAVKKRELKGSTTIICLVVGLSYWLAYLTATGLATTTSLPPWLLVWAPNILFAGVPLLLQTRVFQRT